MRPASPTTAQVKNTVYCKFLDHCWFRNADPELAKPIVTEAWGVLDNEDSDYIRLIAARYSDPTVKGDPLRASGLVILRSTILELRRLD